MKAGVKSTAVLFGDYVRPILAVFACAFLCALTYTGIATNATTLYYGITVVGAGLCFSWQLLTLDFDDNGLCWAAFKVCSLQK